MTTTSTDRIAGISTSVAVKAPVRVATTANITLSGLQTIDGVTVSEGDSVLVKDQSSSANNGIYYASSTAWDRREDLDDSRDVVSGTVVYVRSGTINGSNWFQATVAATPPVIGTTGITWAATYVSLTPISSATETAAGVAELATQAETNTGSDDARIVTPLKLHTKLASYPITNAHVQASVITGQVADATPDRAADYVLTYDASAGGLKKALIQNLGVGSSYAAKTSGYTVISTDNGSVIDFTTAGVTCSLTSAATLGAGFRVTIINSASSGIVTIDPASTETLDGQSTRPLSFGRTRVTIVSDGTNWRTINGYYIYEVTGQTVTLGGDLTLSHGLGVIPDTLIVNLVCASAEANYSVGDEVVGWSLVSNSGSQGMQPRVSSTQIVLNQSSAIYVLDKTGHTFDAITAANWTWRVKAIAR